MPSPTAAEPRRRWYRPPPGLLLLGLLAVEGILLLSERFQWFAINEYKGLALLNAVASVGVTIAAMLLWFLISLVSHRRFQFGVRSLLVLAVCIAITCSWLAVEIRQKAAVKAILQAGGTVRYDDRGGDLQPRITLLRDVFGEDYFANVIEAEVVHPEVMEGGIERLSRLGHLQSLAFKNARITPEGLQHLSGLRQLRSLSFYRTEIMPEGLEHLKSLGQLRFLSFCNTEITPEGMARLGEMRELRYLSLGSNYVTDAALQKLGRLRELDVLVLSDNDITDAGLRHLEGLSALSKLDLSRTRITDAGLAHVKRLTQLRTLDLSVTQITDAGLEHLKALAELRWLSLHGTQVTGEGVESLQNALPHTIN